MCTEAPEEVVETRSLYEQLQAQKDAKQLEYDEQHRLSAYFCSTYCSVLFRFAVKLCKGSVYYFLMIYCYIVIFQHSWH